MEQVVKLLFSEDIDFSEDLPIAVRRYGSKSVKVVFVPVFACICGTGYNCACLGKMLCKKCFAPSTGVTL